MQRAQQVAAGAETVRQVPTGKRKHGSGRDRAVRAVAEQLQAAPAPPEGFEACEHEGYLYNNTNRQYLHTESGIFLCNDQRGNQMYFNNESGQWQLYRKAVPWADQPLKKRHKQPPAGNAVEVAASITNVVVAQRARALICEVCKRRFPSSEHLERHVQHSQLHKDNLAKIKK